MSEKVDETIARARRMSEKIDVSIHERIEDLNKIMLEQQKLIDDYVHEQPYMAMGVGLLAGLGLGFLLCGRTRRRRD
jgi:ElaB/YqjD/DUF883 family membrane-anchored ribosome-binding protein